MGLQFEPTFKLAFNSALVLHSNRLNITFELVGLPFIIDSLQFHSVF